MISISPSTRNSLREIGGSGKVIGAAKIQIPLEAVGIIIEVDYSIMDEQDPSLLYNRIMIENGLDISLQGSYINVGKLRQPLNIENYFLVYRWPTENTPYYIYTEKNLRRIHRTFGHLTVRATQMF